MNDKFCSECTKKVNELFIRGQWCRPCSRIKLRRQAIASIQLNFSVNLASPFNQRIFDMCCADLERFKVRMRDIAMLERLANDLTREPIPEPQSWQEVLTLSSRLGIRYSAEGSPTKKIKCPVLRWGLDLKMKAKAQRQADEMVKRFETTLLDYDSKARPFVRAYLEEYLAKSENYQEMVRKNRRLRHFCRYLKSDDDFLNPQPQAFQAYFKNQNRITNTLRIKDHLNRFYVWSVSHGHTKIDPFKNWISPRVRKLCARCREMRMFNSNHDICAACRQGLQCLRRLDKLILSHRAVSPYNQHLFDLYIKYIKRSKIDPQHIVATEALIQFLKNRPSMPAIRSWRHVLALSNALTQEHGCKLHGGCPIVKIGRMLQELGVLPIRERDREIDVDRVLSRCEASVGEIFRRYSQHLINKKCAMGGVYTNIATLTSFHRWVAKNHAHLSLFTLSEKIALDYLDGLRDHDRSGIRRKALNRFYRWSKLERLTLINPFGKIPVPKPARSMCVCSDQQIAQIEKYVKSTDSDPEFALILTLVLYWGLSGVELSASTIDIHDEQIWINLYRRELRRGRSSYNRDQILKLPTQPRWLGLLQKRYIKLWQVRFDHAKKDFPNQTLLLRRHRKNRSTRPMTIDQIIDLFCEATIAATGVRIPPNVVRRTSGHIHVDHGDASRLAQLGWSKATCSSFSWLPRTYYSPTKTS